ncbi:MAG: helix-turn-helix domain-containing protein, partial [Candidatus Bathyarchaeota archaeon]
AVIFLASSSVIMLLYYRRMRRANEKYNEAKDIVKDIIISFNKQLKLLEERTGLIAHKLEFLSVKREDTPDITGITDQLKKHERQFSDITSKLDTALGVKEHLLPQIEKLSERVGEVVKAQEEVAQRISRPREAQIRGVIPIKRERALAQLTETELRVLEILTKEGQKTAPEIKSQIGLTREHTARLMKKLYVKGYVERDEAKTPYAYRIKEEMRKILKKTESVSQ